MPPETGTLRLDKWLWAARFYKTRGLAAEAIKGGKVHVNGARVKSARAIRLGDRLDITRGEETFTVTVNALNAQRRPAAEAQALYTETAESCLNREAQALQRALVKTPGADRRPDKHQRRQLRRLTGKE